MRSDGRRPDELRPLEIRTDFLEQPHGAVLYGQGRTIVLCTAMVEEGVPRWLYGKGRGWMTAEYSMLPASTGERTPRAVSRGRPDGRTVEIVVSDDGRGGAIPGQGIADMRGRIEELGGSLTLDSPPEMGTTLRASIPCV